MRLHGPKPQGWQRTRRSVNSGGAVAPRTRHPNAEPIVRIHFPPPASPRTLGPSRDEIRPGRQAAAQHSSKAEPDQAGPHSSGRTRSSASPRDAHRSRSSPSIAARRSGSTISTGVGSREFLDARAVHSSRGTEGSNPAPSSDESTANPTAPPLSGDEIPTKVIARPTRL
jgi:hypothetical protein